MSDDTTKEVVNRIAELIRKEAEKFLGQKITKTEMLAIEKSVLHRIENFVDVPVEDIVEKVECDDQGRVTITISNKIKKINIKLMDMED